MPEQSSTPVLVFFTRTRSGPARRMESLLAHLARKERGRLRISRIDADTSPEWVAKLRVEDIPTLVLIKDRRPVARLEGRVSAPQIERMLEPHLAPRSEPVAV
jgi:thioredoxin 1